MRTTLDLPENLLRKAMQITHIETKTKVIITALEELISKNKITGIREFKGEVDLDINLDEVQSRECRF